MKKYFNYILMTFLGVLISCTPEKWTEEPTVMTDIYRLENLRDGLAIDVYRNLPLMIEEKGNLLTSFATSDFVDNSTNKIYSFSYSVVIKSKADTKSGDEQTILKKYVCDGSRQSGMAKLVVETYINDVWIRRRNSHPWLFMNCSVLRLLPMFLLLKFLRMYSV